MACDRPIGVFDSGMGGLSVLRELVKQLPDENFIYLGDNINAPYGIKSSEEILYLTRRAVYSLTDKGVKAIVIACNTATSAAAAALRAELSIPILGIEPALKPASIYANGAPVAVLATDATLTLPKYRRLEEKFGINTINIPAPRLVEFVESGDTSSIELEDYILGLFKDTDIGTVAAVVLGCTHFVFLKGVFEKLMPNAKLFDGNAGIARNLASVLNQRSLLREQKGGGYILNTTSPDDKIKKLMQDYMLTR